MQPFTYKHLLVIGITLVSWLAGQYLWRMPLLLDIVVRSGITTAVYGLLTYYLKISEDINDKVNATIKKLYKFIQ